MDETTKMAVWTFGTTKTNFYPFVNLGYFYMNKIMTKGYVLQTKLMRATQNPSRYYDQYLTQKPPNIFSFEMIDLSTLPINSEQTNGGRILRSTIYNDIELFYLADKPTYFNWNMFHRTLGYTLKTAPQVLYDLDYYRPFIGERNIDEDVQTFKCLKQREYFITTSMFELLLHKLNTYRYFVFKFKQITGLNFETMHNPIVTNVIGTWSGASGGKLATSDGTFSLCSYLDQLFIVSKDDGYVAIKDALLEFCRKVDRVFPLKFDSSAALGMVYMKNLIRHLAESGISEPLFNTRPMKLKPQKFAHWKLILLMMDSLYSFEFWDFLRKYYAPSRELSAMDVEELPDFEIDLSNSLVRRINDRFAIATHADMEIMFDSKTNYIHISTIGQRINPSKMLHLRRFITSDDVAEFIEASDLYIPATATEYVISDSRKPAWYKLRDVQNEYRGYYFHIDMFMYFIMWLDKRFAVKCIRMLNMMLHLSAVKNQRLADMYMDMKLAIEHENELLRERIEEQTRDIETLESIIEERRNILIQINPIKGSIKITRVTDDQIRIQAETYPLLKDRKTIMLEHTYIPTELSRRIKAYIKSTTQSCIRYTGHNKYDIQNLDEATELINHIIDGTAPISYTNPGVDAEYVYYVEKYRANPTPQRAGKLYEYTCLRQLSDTTQLWKNTSPYFLSYFRLSPRDIGIDLIDIPNRTAYQCKLYSHKVTYRDIETFLRTVSMIRETEMYRDFKATLIVQDRDMVSDTVVGVDILILDRVF